MKLLVTGAAGFIGGSLARSFRSRGDAVFTDADPDASGSTRRWPMSDSSLAQTMAGETPDVILHAAGSGTVAKVAANPAVELPANLSALLAVLQYAQQHAPLARVVLLSSAALYGDAPATPQRECDARAPVSLYGVAKAQAEQLAEYYAERMQVQTTVVRLFSVYGQGLRKQLLWDAMNKFAAGQAMFFGTGQERRDWVHIDDVARFMESLLGRPPRRAFDVYNVAGSPATTSEVLSTLAEAAGAPTPSFNGVSRAGDPQCLVADCSKAESTLDWRARIGWRDGVVAYADWFSRSRSTAAVEPLR